MNCWLESFHRGKIPNTYYETFSSHLVRSPSEWLLWSDSFFKAYSVARVYFQTNESCEPILFNESKPYIATNVVRFLNEWLWWTDSFFSESKTYRGLVLFSKEWLLWAMFFLLSLVNQSERLLNWRLWNLVHLRNHKLTLSSFPTGIEWRTVYVVLRLTRLNVK